MSWQMKKSCCREGFVFITVIFANDANKVWVSYNAIDVKIVFASSAVDSVGNVVITSQGIKNVHIKLHKGISVKGIKSCKTSKPKINNVNRSKL